MKKKLNYNNSNKDVAAEGCTYWAWKSPLNINWFESQSGKFKNLSIFQKKISIDSCPGIYYCQYEEMIADIEYSLHTTDLFIINCPIVKEYLERFVWWMWWKNNLT